MHFEILVEGQSELTALSIIMNKILGDYNNPHTWKIHKHQGIGTLPDKYIAPPNKNNRTLLHNLPSKLRAYGKSMKENEKVVLLVDLDDRANCITFKNELLAVINHCESKPDFLIRIAIEELESWYLGDAKGLETAYPDFNKTKYDEYQQDSQCKTWEALAEIVHTGGLSKLLEFGKRNPRVLEEKTNWAKSISPHMNVDDNSSPSFCCFRDGLRRLAGIDI